MTPIRVLFAFGTRPEAIKMASLIQDMRVDSRHFEAVVCATGQHRQMLEQVLDLFGLCPDFNLDVMEPAQTLAALTGRLINELDRVTEQVKPHWICVQGDTTSALTGAMVAFYRGIRVAHVEAGLRTGNMGHPFPEEFNRRVIDVVSEIYFAPTPSAAENLFREGVRADSVVVTGNTGIDSLLRVAEKPCDWNGTPLAGLASSTNLVLITAHRRESFGQPFRDLCMALGTLADQFPDHAFIYPVHLNPNVQKPVRELLSGRSNLLLVDPVDYVTLVHLLKRARLVLTDSGGIQEEAPSFGVPILVMRETTERPEAVEAGFASLVGTDPNRIVAEAAAILSRDPTTTKVRKPNPFGDGRASQRILTALRNYPVTF